MYQKRIRNKIISSRINIDGKSYIPLYSEKSDGIIQKYKKLIEREIKIEAVEENADQTLKLADLAKQRKSLEDLAKKNKFEKNGAGFEKKSSSYYVYVKTGKFAMKSPHNKNYYVFPEAKIGVQIRYSSGRFIVDPPVVMNSYKHPFLSGTGSMQRICLGHFRSSDAIRGKSTEESTRILLDAGRKNIVMGYVTGGNPYKSLNNNNFSGYKKSKAYIQKNKIPCLNEDMVDKRR